MSTDGSAGDGYTRCPKCGLPYWAYPSDFTVQPATCQCNRLTIPMPANPDSGWICPKCGNVYSPNTMECVQCNNTFPTTNITDWETNT